MKLRTCLLVFSLFALPSLPPLSAGEETSAIRKFDSDFSLRLYLKYNCTLYVQGDAQDQSFLSNRPMDMGAGFNYRNLAFRISTGIPFLYNRDYPQSRSLDLQLQYHNRYISVDAALRSYRGLRPLNQGNLSREIDLEILSAGVMAQYPFNGKNHSLKAAYSLSEMQTASSGSWLIGGGFYYTSLISNDLAVHQYIDKQRYIYGGPNAGYSHTWVLDNLLFFNAGLSLGIHLGTETASRNLFVSPAAFPRLALGYHFDNWSWSLSFTGSALPLTDKYSLKDLLFFARGQLTFVRRFPRAG